MPVQFARILFSGLILGLLTAERIVACPYCKADATGISAESATDVEDGGLPVMISGGLDFASAFYFRGYLQADRGLILQPYLNVFTRQNSTEDLVIRPYVSLFNSSHFGNDNPMADMSDVMVGAVTDWHAFSFDTRYAFFTMSPMMRTPVHEIGARVSYDALQRWSDVETLAPFRLKPFVGVYGDYIQDLDEIQMYLNLGVEPSWRVDVAGCRVGMSLPLEWGLGGNGYYSNANGSNATYGYFSTSLTASVALPVSDRLGQWFLNGTLQYLHLAADSVQMAARGNDDGFAAKFGLSFVY